MSKIDELDRCPVCRSVALESGEYDCKCFDAYEAAKTQAAPVIKNNSTGAEVVFNDGVFIVQDKTQAAPVVSECCSQNVDGERFCPKCGWECRIKSATVSPDGDGREVELSIVEKVALAILDKLVKMDVPLDIGKDITTLAEAAFEVVRPYLATPKRESSNHSDLQKVMEALSPFKAGGIVPFDAEHNRILLTMEQYNKLTEAATICQRNLGKE